MPPPGNARLLAPVALASFVLALIVIVAGSSGNEDGVGPPPSRPATTAATSTTAREEDPASARTTSEPAGRTATVQAGETPAAIAQREGVALERLLELNPDLDPTALRTGQTLRIAP